MRLGEWKPPILKTEATTGAGVDGLWKESRPVPQNAASEHRQSRRRQRHVSRLRDLLALSFLRARREARCLQGSSIGYVEAVASRARDPYSVVEEIMNRIPSPGSRIPG